MGNKVTLVRQDGTTLDATPEQAEKLKLLGYKEETPEEMTSRARAEAEEDYYTSTDQRLATGFEGVVRGVTLGGSDYLFGDESTSKRAQYNPGIATASEIAGAVGAEFVPGLNVIAPAALAGRGARALVKGTGAGRAALRGGLEGGAIGGAMAADHAYLKGDPVTAEAVLHGVGWGALFGAGMSAAASGVMSRGAKNIDEGLALKAEADRVVPKFEAAPGSYAAATKPAFTGLAAEAKALSTEIKKAVDTTEAIFSGNRRKLAQLGFDKSMEAGAIGRAKHELDSAFRRFSKAANKKGFTEEKFAKAADDFNKVAAKTAEKAGIVGGDAKQALMEYAQMKILQRELRGFPTTPQEFASMTPKRAENLFATLETAKKLSKFPALGTALEGQANKLQEALGVNPEGVTGLRAAWNIAKKQVKAEKTAVQAPEIADAGGPGLVRRGVAAGAGFLGYKAVAVGTGHPLVALGAGAKVRNWVLNAGTPKTPELVAARNKSLGRIKQAVGGFQIKAGKVGQAIAPKLSPLALRLDGSVDSSTKDASQLAYNRIKEFAEAAPHIADTMYRAVEPIAIEQPELGPALHQAGISTFNAARSLMPSDPGVVSGLKSIWKPSSLQAAVMSRQLAVFQDPVGVAEEMLYTNLYDPIKVKALKEIAPAVFQTLRVEMIGRIQEPGFLDSMDYRSQVSLGSMLDIPIHSSMKPEYIAASQQLHMSRNIPLPTPTIPGSSNGGRPAADTPGATAAQISTAR